MKPDGHNQQTERTSSGLTPHRTTRAELERLVAVPVFSATDPNAAGAIPCGRGTGYQLVRDGVIPSRRIGSKILVPTKPFLAWLDGTDSTVDDTGIATA